MIISKRIQRNYFFLLENPRQAGQRAFLAQRRLRIGNFQTISPWNGILAGMFHADRVEEIISIDFRIVLQSSIDIR